MTSARSSRDRDTLLGQIAPIRQVVVGDDDRGTGAGRRRMHTWWNQSTCGILPTRTMFDIVVVDDVTEAIRTLRPDAAAPFAYAAFVPPLEDEETDGTFLFPENPPLALIVHEAGHAAHSTFLHHGLSPLALGAGSWDDHEEALVHFVGMLSAALVELLLPARGA